ncbi:MAG: serine/threonine-protein phosphatase [Akkermansiaceae bacterium]|nr:serine/threonine-protein phosphatase [Armatimonadota bacterium]
MISPVHDPFVSGGSAFTRERDRRIAEILQGVLLRSHPRETLCGLSVETFYEAAMDEASVGGDSVDAFPLTGSRIALTVADASGKGLAATERIAEVRFALRAFLREHDDPRHALSCLNDFACAARSLGRRDVGTFVTLTLVVLDSLTGEITCLCAGGEPPLLLRIGGTNRAVSVLGPALGLCPGLCYETATEQLEPGDAVLLATDGITEARHFLPGDPPGSRGSSFLGMEGLARIARRREPSGPDKRMSLYERGLRIVEDARAFAGGTFHDDACLLIARLESPDHGRALLRNVTEMKG